MTDERSRPGCLRRSCCGCVTLVLAALAIAVVVAAAGALRPSTLREETLTPAVGAPPVEGAPTIVELDVATARLEVVAAEPGQPFRVTSSHRPGRHVLEHSVEPASAGAPERWRVGFETAGWTVPFFTHHGNAPAVRVELPRDRRLVLRLRAHAGVSTVDLGGLDLVEADAAFSTGQHALAFSAPTVRPLEALRVTSTLAQCRVDGLGNASPRATVVDSETGEVALDLSGAWAASGRVAVAHRMGTLRLRVPPDVPVVVERLHAEIGHVSTDALPAAAAEPGARVVTLDASVRLGSIEVSR